MAFKENQRDSGTQRASLGLILLETQAFAGALDGCQMPRRLRPSRRLRHGERGQVDERELAFIVFVLIVAACNLRLWLLRLIGRDVREVAEIPLDPVAAISEDQDQ